MRRKNLEAQNGRLIVSFGESVDWKLGEGVLFMITPKYVT